MLGSKIALDVSKGEKNASQRPLEKRIKKSIKKLRFGRPPGGKCRVVWKVNDAVLGSRGGFTGGEAKPLDLHSLHAPKGAPPGGA